MTVSGFFLTVVMSGILGLIFGFALGQDYDIKLRKN